MFCFKLIYSVLFFLISSIVPCHRRFHCSNILAILPYSGLFCSLCCMRTTHGYEHHLQGATPILHCCLLCVRVLICPTNQHSSSLLRSQFPKSSAVYPKSPNQLGSCCNIHPAFPHAILDRWHDGLDAQMDKLCASPGDMDHVLSMTRTVLARTTAVAMLIGGISVWWTSPVCLTISKSQSSAASSTRKDSCRRARLNCQRTRLSIPHLLARLPQYHVVDDPTVRTDRPLALLAIHAYYSTGHHSTISVQWESAFVFGNGYTCGAFGRTYCGTCLPSPSPKNMYIRTKSRPSHVFLFRGTGIRSSGMRSVFEETFNGVEDICA